MDSQKTIFQEINILIYLICLCTIIYFFYEWGEYNGGEIGDSIKLFFIILIILYNTIIYYKLKTFQFTYNIFWGIFILQITPNILYLNSLNSLFYNCC
jgi:hypothetical protein